MVKSVKDVINFIESEKTKLEFMPTGFLSLDQHLDGGFLRKELVVIGAHTGIGKSYIAGQLMLNIALQGFKCAYYSLEISNEMVVSRLLGTLSNLKPTRIRLGLLTPEEQRLKIQSEADLLALSDLMFFYDDLYTLEEISKSIREHDYDFVIVDFLQIIIAKGTDEYTRLTDLVRGLQQLAKEKDLTILSLSQLSNAAAREGNKSKTLEYKGSGAIATVCDLGFFFERGKKSDIVGEDHSVNLILRKNRRGSSGNMFPLFFQIPGGRIYE